MLFRGRVMSFVVAGVAGVGAVGCGAGDDDTPGGGTGGTDPLPAIAYCDPARAWTDSAAALEDEIVALVNEQRAGGAICGGQALPPVPALVHDAALRCAARVHVRDMVDRDYFDHTNPDGEEPWDRMVRAGYEWAAAGENIAGGNRAAAATMTQWMNSAGHCRNIMSADFEHIGVGHAEDGGLWTQVFGAPR
jgi:uncharacterized protein YkwD